MSSLTQYLLVHHEFFARAEEYIQLTQRFKTETYSETLSLCMTLGGELVLSCLMKASGMSLALVLYKTCMAWIEYIRYLGLRADIAAWRAFIHANGGPYISTNDETYLPYVYADAMQRYHNRLFGLPKKGTKRFE